MLGAQERGVLDARHHGFARLKGVSLGALPIAIICWTASLRV
jgi:hypothetical protein